MMEQTNGLLVLADALSELESAAAEIHGLVLVWANGSETASAAAEEKLKRLLDADVHKTSQNITNLVPGIVTLG